jgi:hypothetical protein
VSDFALPSEHSGVPVVPATAGNEQPADPPASTPFCVRCVYNLTGLTSSRCPECGWVIDWSLARRNEEERRVGTPAHQTRGWRRPGAILSTILLMLFRPLRFARRLRWDESYWPAVVVSAGSCLLAAAPFCILGRLGKSDIRWGTGYASAILSCVLLNSFFFATLCRDRLRLLCWRKRLRLFLLLSFYTTCFVAVWPYFGPPLCYCGSANFFCPIASYDPFPGGPSVWQFWGRTAIFYWWVLILLVFVFTRTKSVWARVLCFPLIWASCSVAYWVGFLVYDRFPFKSW